MFSLFRKLFQKHLQTRILQKWLLALSYLLLPCLPAHAEPAQKTLTIAADKWCPINCDAEGAEAGIGIDLAKQVFEPLGYRIHYVIMPWSRALDEEKKGNVDAVVGANTADDPSLIFPKNAIQAITDDFYVLADNPLQFKGVESLNGQRIGIIKDYGYSEKIQQFVAVQRRVPGAIQSVSGENALQQNIQKLLAGRIDMVIESALVMDYTLKNMHLADKIRHIGGIPQGSVYLAFSPLLPQSKTLAKQYDDGIQRLKTEGRLAALYAPYGLAP